MLFDLLKRIVRDRRSAMDEIADRRRSETQSAIDTVMPDIDAGLSAYVEGRVDVAERIAARTLLGASTSANDQGRAHQLLSVIARGRGQDADALGHARQAAERLDDHADVWLLLALTARTCGSDDEYARALGHAYRLAPSSPEIGVERAQCLARTGHVNEALELASRLVHEHPARPDLRTCFGTLLYDAGQVDAAIIQYQRVLALQPNSAAAAFNLANALRVGGAFEAARNLYREALRHDPGLIGAWLSLGAISHDARDFPKALDAFDRALSLQADYLPAQLNRALTLLASGDLEQGWPAHEVRLRMPDRLKEAQRHTQPAWHGEPLARRQLLVWGEQGVGDEIVFSTLIEELAQRIGPFILECRLKLLPLFRRSFPEVTVVPRTDPVHPAARDADVQIAAGSLGGMLRPEVASFPDRLSHLRADAGRVSYWHDRLASLGPGVNVGICWRSSNRSGDRAFSCSRLTQWGALFALPGVRYVCLQYDDCAAELAEVRQQGANVTRFPEVDYFDDLDEVSALMSALDGVVSAPTVVSQQAAALGVPTYQLTFGTDWQTHGTDRDLWLPSIRRYPRAWEEDWSAVLARVAVDLSAFLGQRGQPSMTIGTLSPAKIQEK